MGFNVDYKELNAYISSMTMFQKGFYNFLKTLLLEMAERVLAKTKLKTPVDTGALRGSWELGDIQGFGENISVEILNGMEYASYIEYGHRIMTNGTEIGWYNGRFMLKTSIEEIQKQIPLRYEKEFKQFCKEHNLAI